MICVLAGALIFNIFYLGFLLLVSVLVFGYLIYFLGLYLSTSSSFYQIAAGNKNKMCRVLTSQLMNAVNLRVLNKSYYLQQDFNHFCDYFQSASSHLGKSGLCVGIRSFVCGVAFIFCVQCFPVFAFNIMEEFYTLNDFWKISMAIAWGIKTIGFMSMAMNNLSSLSMSLITVEKCFDWIDHSDVENVLGMRDYDRDDAWPALQLNNVNCLSNNGNKLDLKNVTMNVQKNTRVALLGTDGSGKADVHMVSLALKRLRKFSRDNGSIRIFGQSSSETSINSIRKATVTLFKDGKLFSGTVRDNIDYERTHITDEVMIKTLYWLKVLQVLNPDQKIKKNSKDVLQPIDPKDSVIMNKDSYETFASFINSKNSTIERSDETILRNYLELKVQPNGANFEESQRKII